MYIILYFMFFIGIPVGTIIFFIMSLLGFKGTPKDHLYYRKRKTRLIVSAVLMGIVVTSVVSLIVLAHMIIRNM